MGYERLAFVLLRGPVGINIVYMGEVGQESG